MCNPVVPFKCFNTASTRQTIAKCICETTPKGHDIVEECVFQHVHIFAFSVIDTLHNWPYLTPYLKSMSFPVRGKAGLRDSGKFI